MQEFLFCSFLLNKNVFFNVNKVHHEKLNIRSQKGYSAETNIKYYTYASKDNMDDLVNLFNAATEVSP